MHLYITANGIKVEVSGITLRDGCVPSVSGHDPGDVMGPRADDDCALEPAIWFKVLAIESLCIDCTRRMMTWHYENSGSSSTLSESSDTSADGGSQESHKKDSGIITCVGDNHNTMTDTRDSNIDQALCCNAAGACHMDDVPEARWKDSGIDAAGMDVETNAGKINEVSCANEVSGTMTNVLNSADRTKAASLARRAHHFSESLFSDGSYTFDCEADEAFDLLPALVSRFHLNVLTTGAFHAELRRLLHLHILPSIRLGAESALSVQRALLKQRGFESQVDAEMFECGRSLTATRDSMKSQRDGFLNELIAGGEDVERLPTRLLDLLEEDLNNDVNKTMALLDQAQAKVDERKLEMAAGLRDGELSCKLLSRVRHERNAVSSEYERLLKARAALKELREQRKGPGGSAIWRIRSLMRAGGGGGRGKHDDQLHQVYYGLRQLERDFVARMSSLAERKLLVISVREAILATVAELERGVETNGVDVNATGGQRATDVLGGGAVSQAYSTLSQRVEVVLTSPHNALARKHLAFCQRVVDRCRAAIAERPLYDAGFAHGSGEGDKPLALGAEGEFVGSAVQESILEASQDLSGLKVWQSVELERSVSSSSSVVEQCSMRQSVGSVVSSSSQQSAHSDISFCPSGASVVSGKNSVGRASGRRLKLLRLRSKSSVPTPTFRSYLPGGITSPNSIAGPVVIGLPTDVDDVSERASRQWTTTPGGSFVVTELALQGDLTPLASSTPSSSLSDSFVNDAVVVFEANKDYVKAAIESLTRDIAAHFDSMCLALEAELDLSPLTGVHYNKLWVHYESHFYQLTADALQQLYTLEYSGVTRSLCASIRTLSARDLQLEDAILTLMLQEVSELDDNVVDEVHEGDMPLQGGTGDRPLEVGSSDRPPGGGKNDKPLKGGISAAKTTNEDKFDYSQLRRSTHRRKAASVKLKPKAESLVTGLSAKELVEFELTTAANTRTNRSQSERLAKEAEVTTHGANDIIQIAGETVAGTTVTLVTVQVANSTVDPAVVPASESVQRYDEASTKSDHALVRGSVTDAHDASLAMMRRHASESMPLRPNTRRLSVVVKLRNSREVITYDRTLCPPLATPAPRRRDGNLLAGVVMTTIPGTLPPSPGALKSLRLKVRYKEQFGKALKLMKAAMGARGPTAKLQLLHHCVQEVSRQISAFNAEMGEKSKGACSDDLVDALIILLCNVDDLPALYCQIQALTALVAPFHEHGALNFSLVQFYAAAQFIMDRVVLRRKDLHVDGSAVHSHA